MLLFVNTGNIPPKEMLRSSVFEGESSASIVLKTQDSNGLCSET